MCEADPRQKFQVVPDGGYPRIVVLQHHPRDPLGALTPALSRGSHLTWVRGYRDLLIARELVERLVGTGGYDGVVALGGPMGVYDRGTVPYLQESLRLLDDALGRGKPVLGLCLGSQLLAHAAGAAVFPGADRGFPPEVGFSPLILAPEAADDPVMGVYKDADRVLFWHQDTHDLPAGARLLASTELYPVSAYRVADHAYGIQFHLETTAQELRVWVRHSSLVERAGVDAGRIVAEAIRRDLDIRHRADELGELFVEWARVERCQNG